MRFLLATVVFLAAGQPAMAAAGDPVSLGVFQDWEAFTYRAASKQVCYVYSRPRDSYANREFKREQPHFMVTHWPAKRTFGEVSTVVGYTFKEGSQATLLVDAKTFAMPTEGDGAWVPQPEFEAKIIAALKKGSDLRIIGTTKRGAETVDSYSLRGFTAAMDKIDEACK